MTNDDLKKLQEYKTELFEGVGRTLESLGLGHLQVVGLELEPSSVKISSDQPNSEKGFLEGTAEHFICPAGTRRVLRVDPQTGQSFYICV